MNSGRYWKMRKLILNCIFKIKKIIYGCTNRIQHTKENRSFRDIVFVRFVSGALKALVLASIFRIIDIALSKNCLEFALNYNIFADVIIGELGVSGVILGLYCSNVSSVYSTSYSNAPKKIAIAFQYDRLTIKCINDIIGFITYGTFVLVELLFGINVGLVSGGVLIIWSLLVVISYGIVGNRIYQLSDVFRLSDDAIIVLNRIFT